MFLLLDKNREMVAELVDWLSITANIRFSSPGQLNVTLSEVSEEAKLVEEMMYIFHTDTSMLFLIDYIERNVVLNDIKAVTLKCITIEGFLEQRVIFQDKLLDGSTIQTAIQDFLKESVIEPVDTTRTLDIFAFVQSTDPNVTGVTVKGLVSGISVMQAITSLLEVKNMGYKVTYDMTTKKASFTILAGRNLCEGFTSLRHGASLESTVTLSSQSETLKDIRSIVDLTPYKTRVYVKNFDELKIFNRGATETGMNLREGYLSTGHGDSFAGYDVGTWTGPDIPPPPDITFPEISFPGEIEIPEPPLETNLVGLYLLTNQNRLLGCAFYPDTPIPELWFDITPEQENGVNVSLRTDASAVTLRDGDLIIASGDRKKIYRASMTGGWFGTRWFKQAEVIFDVGKINLVDGQDETNRGSNYIGSLGVDIRTGRVMGTAVNTVLDNTWPGQTWTTYSIDQIWPWSSSHHARVFGGTAYDLALISDWYKLDIAWPSSWLERMVINNDVATLSGILGTMNSRLLLYDIAKKTWEILDNGGSVGAFYKTWHARPEENKDVMYCTAVIENISRRLYRSRDSFGGGPLESVVINADLTPHVGSFSLDGRSIFYGKGGGPLYLTTIPTGDLAGTTTVTKNRPHESETVAATGFAGTDKVTGAKRWGYVFQGRWALDSSYWVRPGYYVTTNQDLTGFTNITPLLRDYLIDGPWGLTGNQLNEWPVFAWPILG